MNDTTKILIEPGHKRCTLREFLVINQISAAEAQDIKDELGKGFSYAGGGGSSPVWAIRVDPISTLQSYPKPDISLTAQELNLFSEPGSDKAAKQICAHLNKCIREVIAVKPERATDAARVTWDMFWHWADINYDFDQYGIFDYTAPREAIAHIIGRYFGVSIDCFGDV